MALALSCCSAALIALGPAAAIDSAIAAMIVFACFMVSSGVVTLMAWAGMPRHAPHGHAMWPYWQGTWRDRHLARRGSPPPARHKFAPPLAGRGDDNFTETGARLSRSTQRASGSGRIWKCTIFGEFSLPPSRWNGVRLPVFDQMPIG